MPLAEQTTASFDKALGWPSVASETLPWERDPDELAGIPKSRRRKILPTYEATVPAHIAEVPVALPDETHNRLAEVSLALALDDDLSVEGIRAIHRELINRGGASFGGELRDAQVWVGGSAYSPHGALFVPPHASHVPDYLDDLVVFSLRDDVSPIAKAAIVHAQFETVHPFIDGNGRTGRTLLHKMLRRDGVLEHATLPVSAGLLHGIDAYMAAIKSYQAGDVSAIVTQLADALELAVALGNLVARRLDEVIGTWRTRMSERAGSAILRLPDVLVEQPVVDSAFIEARLGVTRRAATSVIEKACGYGMLRPIGNRMRGEFYQADELIDVLEEISDMAGIRRVLATGSV